MDRVFAETGWILTCPHCYYMSRVDKPEHDDTYTTTCPGCLKEFNYVVTGGVLKDWQPPKISGIVYRGIGEAGGS